MGVPQKPKTRKKCAKGKKSCKTSKKPMPMWGGSPASDMLFQDLANPTNPDNYLNADIPLIANQTRARGTMTGGSLASSAVVGAVNTQREPGAMLNDYESAMDLKGCGGKAVMTGGSIASNRVTSLVNLPGVLKPEEVTRTVPDYLSTEHRPDNYNLTGGAINHQRPLQRPLQRQFAMAPVEQHGQVVGPEGQVLVPQPGEEWEGDWNHPPADRPKPKPKRGSKKVSKRRSTGRTVQPKFQASKRTSKRHTMTGGASGFWSGVAGCGPVNVPNAGNTLSKFFTKSSSCPGPDFYANPPNLGTAGSGYATELPSGAPFPFM